LRAQEALHISMTRFQPEFFYPVRAPISFHAGFSFF